MAPKVSLGKAESEQLGVFDLNPGPNIHPSSSSSKSSEPPSALPSRPLPAQAWLVPNLGLPQLLLLLPARCRKGLAATPAPTGLPGAPPAALPNEAPPSAAR